MTISPARTAAFDVLYRIETERAFSSILLPQYEANLSPGDRGLCHQLVLGVLRRKLFLDRLIEVLSRNRKLDIAVKISLRLGLFQLKFLDRIPAHSAVNESVNLVHRAKKSSARTFVNALLRRATREPIEPEYESEKERVSIETSHPRWLIEKWIGQFGGKEAAALAAANNEPPGAAFRFTSGSSAEISDVRPSQFVQGAFLADSVTPELTGLFTAGKIYFQDEASQLAGGSVRLLPGDRLLDVCAAPGSKITQIASIFGSTKHFFAAGELHAHRARFLMENCRAHETEVSVVQYDAENALPFGEESFDSVMVDAPCSGTGTIRHNPEIRYFLDPSDFDKLSGKQLRILRNASNLVRKGGRLLYSTCSLEREEDEDVAESFLALDPRFSKVSPHLPDQFLGPQGYGRTFPHRDRMDGFFIAEFVRSRTD